MEGFQIANVYKPLNVNWDQQVLLKLAHPAVYIGDFNSHHPDWEYLATDTNREQLVEWVFNNDLALIQDAKQGGTFTSARWSHEYSPDLRWVSSGDGHAQPASYLVLEDFTNCQHRLSIIHIGQQLPIFRSCNKPRWNFRKADWKNTQMPQTKLLSPYHHPISWSMKLLGQFQGVIFKATCASTLRSYHPVYTLCLGTECAKLLSQCEPSSDPDIAAQRSESLVTAR